MERLDTPNCYIRAQTVTHAMILPMAKKHGIGGAFVVPGLVAPPRDGARARFLIPPV